MVTKSEPFFIVGTMSGTSLDGLDIAIVCYEKQKYQLTEFTTIDFPKELQNSLRSLANEPTTTINFLMKTNTAFTKFAAQAIRNFATSKIDLVSFSGQTIRHLPEDSATLQLGSGGMLSSILDMTVVSDFRSQDIGAGGQGAPLVPFVDNLLFAEEAPIVLLNIGGIANITYIGKDREIIAFDTGPGNMVIDALVKHYYKQDYDAKGQIAAQGRVDKNILKKLLLHNYFSLTIPKSTGRNDFGKNYMDYFIKETSQLNTEDKIAVVTELTATSIANAINQFCTSTGKIVISGGGKHNATLMNSLQKKLSSWQFVPIGTYGISEDAKEAFAFAVLGHQTLLKCHNHIPSTTGANKKLILGAVYYACK
ncbi:anhydro-N-acetylmuramic acid kinase [Candidatus Uabimicrobium sp. HlEnr_7]|uniref:anhydro-N-acetylmuramic acid kinase n=1 Tax=Candidatus Uabimicrobium helgolandensis TaxID=3095367 RepID=UPI0035589E3A